MTKLVEIDDESLSDEGQSTAILYRASEVLGENGWCQGAIKDLDGQFCAVGAIREASIEIMGTRDSWSECVALSRLGSHIRKLNYDPVVTIPRWNDTEGRTSEEVILAMKRTAAGE